MIDSGADATVFAAVFGRDIGIKIKDGAKAQLSGLGGKVINVYFHEVILEVGSNKVKSFVGVAYAKGVTAILGQIGLFDKFKVGFNQAKGTIEIIPKRS